LIRQAQRRAQILGQSKAQILITAEDRIEQSKMKGELKNGQMIAFLAQEAVIVLTKPLTQAHHQDQRRFEGGANILESVSGFQTPIVVQPWGFIFKGHQSIGHRA
jgi:hypothetical protein